MKELTGQEHAITFTEVDLKNDEFIQHLTICIGNDYEDSLKVFNKIKEFYPAHKGEPEIVIDFINSNWDIINDYPLTKENAKHLAKTMGHELKV